MTVHKMAKPRLKAKIGIGDYDTEFAALLYFMWKCGMLTKYPLDPSAFPDNADTAEKMAVAVLKLKLKTDCQGMTGFKSKLVKKARSQIYGDH